MFLGGARPNGDDACVYAAASTLSAATLRTAPGVKGWLNTVGMFAPSRRTAWGGRGESTKTASSGTSNACSVPASGGKSREVKDDDGDEVDSLFGDEEEEGDAAASAAGSRAAQMAAAKSQKDKKKKIDRCVECVLLSHPFTLHGVALKHIM